MKVCHLTSVHARDDIRIFRKECCSLAKAGYETVLLVADGKGSETRGGVVVKDVGAPKGRLDRMVRVTRRAYEEAIKVDASIYHLHDPELIPVGVKLKRAGKVVVFDAHEDAPKQILAKPYMNTVMRRAVALGLNLYERRTMGRFDAVVGATPHIRDKFLRMNTYAVDINNFPLWGELLSDSCWSDKQRWVAYVGGITAIRGVREVVQALEHLPGARLQLAGTFSESRLEAEVKSCPGWKRVDELGFVDRNGVKEVLARCVAGIVTFYPVPNHVDAQPNKMFEYMSAGIPVVASDFPLWREIIEGNDCGLCVDPLDPQAIARAIGFLIDNPVEAKRLGENGRRAVQEKYNWSVEETKLIALYQELGECLG